MTERAQILILTFTTFAQEPRALKQARYLKDTHNVTTAGFGPAPFPDVPHVEIPQVASARWGIVGRLVSVVAFVLRIYPVLRWINALDRVAVRLLANREWNLVIAHDLKSLDASIALRPTHGVVLDLHEYAPRQEEQDVVWRLTSAPYFRWMCRRRVKLAAAVVTVGEGIADEYLREYGFESTVVINATPYHELSTTLVGSPIRLVHSGSATAQRRLDILIDGVLSSRADVTLDLYLVGDDATIDGLKSQARGDTRIRFQEPVPYRELINVLNAYDVGVHLLPPLNFNQLWALPNKFFDYVQARLGVIVGPSPEMARIVQERGMGSVLPDFESSSLANVLDSLSSDQVSRWKAASAEHSHELSSESQAAIWAQLTGRLLAVDDASASS